MRPSGRKADELRAVRIQRGFTKHAEGSVLVEFGETRVLCTASVEERVPGFLKDSGRGWVTAEYGMLPRSTNTRTDREAARGKQSGRTQEIQRLIGRSLRAVTDMKAMGEMTVTLDCDVLTADGGTRTASITGAFVAMVDALRHMRKQGNFTELPLLDFVAATSVGKLGSDIALDLNYEEDSKADVDMNIVKTGAGRFVEIQGTAEDGSFSEDEMRALMVAAHKGTQELIAIQRAVLGDVVLKKPKPEA